MISGLKKVLDKALRINACSAVVAAAGSSTRMGGLDKLFLELGGMPVLAHTLTALSKCHSIRELVVVTRPEELERVAALCREYCIEKVAKIIPAAKRGWIPFIMDCCRSRRTRTSWPYTTGRDLS